jgi:biotin carboxyl carrier protein
MNKIQITIDDTPFDAEVQIDPADRTGALVTIDGKTLRVALPHDADHDAVTWALAEGASYEVVIDPQLRWIRSSRGLHRLNVRDLETPAVRPASGDGRVKAPIPGTITQLLIEQGQQVESGQPLLVLEAMKMENQIVAPRAGTVSQINVAEGQGVTLNAVLVEIG